ncbi:MAG: hypothetical protein C4316_05960 [Chloroflexota bacterium]
MGSTLARLGILGTAAILLGAVLGGCGPAGLLGEVTVSADTVTPGADGPVGTATISYQVRREALVTILFRDSAGREYPFRVDQPRAPGNYQAEFSGTYSPDPETRQRKVLPNGEYTVVVRARAPDGTTDERQARLRIAGADSTELAFEELTVTPDTFSPNGDADRDETIIFYSLTRPPTRVDIFATDSRGTSYLLVSWSRPSSGPQSPDQRPRQRDSYVWDGTAAGRVLPDGSYVLHVVAEDRVGAVAEAIKPVKIENGGIPRLELVDFQVKPTTVSLGGTVNVTFRVRNTGTVPIKTLGPPPGTPYRTDITFNCWVNPTDPGSPLYYERSGVWRVGVMWTGAGLEYPARWGLLPDGTRVGFDPAERLKPPEQVDYHRLCTVEEWQGQTALLQPGEEVVVTGTIQINLRIREVTLWAGIEQGGVGFPVGQFKPQVVRVNY